MKNIIKEFDLFLQKKGLTFTGTIIGGAALLIMDIVDRKTKDVDFLDPNIPEPIKTASIEFAQARRDLLLDNEWLNNGPISLKNDLPPGWRLRIQTIYEGTNLKLFALGREDFLKAKLFSYCDRTNPDFDDLLQLKPSQIELGNATKWVKERDQNPHWPKHVEIAFAVLRKALGYESSES